MRNTARPRKTTDRSISMAELLCLGLESTKGAVSREEETFLTWFLTSIWRNWTFSCLLPQHKFLFPWQPPSHHIYHFLICLLGIFQFCHVLSLRLSPPPCLPALTLITLKRGPLSFLLSLPAFCEVPLWVWIRVYRILTALANLPIYLLVLSTRMKWIDFFFFFTLRSVLRLL